MNLDLSTVSLITMAFAWAADTGEDTVVLWDDATCPS